MGFVPPRPPRKPPQMSQEEKHLVTISVNLDGYRRALQAGIISIREFREALAKEGLQVGAPVPRMQPLSHELMRVDATDGGEDYHPTTTQQEVDALMEQLRQKNKELQEALRERMVEPEKSQIHRRLELA